VKRVPGSFLEPLVTPAGRETVRAFVIFTLLLAGIVAIALQVAYRDVAAMAKTQQRLVAADQAASIAEYIGQIGDRPGGLDYSKIRQKIPAIEAEVRRRIEDSGLLAGVEIRDRFGAPLVAVFETGFSAAASREALQVVTVHLQRGANPEGQIRVAVSGEALEREVDRLWRAFRFKVVLASAVAVGILGVGLFYVLRLIRRNRALEQSKISAERAAYRGVLASGLAHEIRNPLNAMNMNLQMLEEELLAVPAMDSEEWSGLLNSTKSEIKRLERLVNNFLQYARPPRPNFEPRDINALVREIVVFLQADFRGQGVELRVESESLLPSAEIDESQLKQALMNILVNARQVMKGGGAIVLTTRAGSGGDVVIDIEDEGPGIPPEMVEKIFEPFYSNRGGGTGLGLPIAKQIVENHGGRIEVEPRAEKGTLFRVHLPRRQDASAPVSRGHHETR
jgi:signal transduction histidine kinase